MKNVQTILMFVFGAFIVLAVMAFAGIIPMPEGKTASQTKGTLVVWGTISKTVVDSLIQEKITSLYNQLSVRYVQKNPDTFAQDLIEALAANMAPDLVILPNDLLIMFKRHLVPFKPDVFSERQFRDTYIDGAGIFVRDEQVLALPVWSDPMVMYWNKNMLSSNNVARPPLYWDEFLTLAPVVTKRNQANEILKSAIAFGEFRNITNAKDIFVTLVLQTGNPMMELTQFGYAPILDGNTSRGIPNIQTSLQFFTDFADPLKPVYSWNRSLPKSKDAFLSEDLAIYFGYASEFSSLREKNPNLNFDVAAIPQVRSSSYKATYGRIGAIGVLNTSRQQLPAFFVAQFFSSPVFSQTFSQVLGIPSPRRDVLAVLPKNPFMKTFNDSALVIRTWLDISPTKTYAIYQTAVESVLSGQTLYYDAVFRAQEEMMALAESKNQSP